MSHSLSLPITAQHSCWDWWQDMGLAGEVRGGGVYIQPSGGGGVGKGVARENTGLNTHRKGGGGGRSRASTQYICTNRDSFLFGFTAF